MDANDFKSSTERTLMNGSVVGASGKPGPGSREPSREPRLGPSGFHPTRAYIESVHLAGGSRSRIPPPQCGGGAMLMLLRLPF